MSKPSSVEDLEARIAQLEARADRHCTPAKPCVACQKVDGLAKQNAMFVSIALESQRRDEQIRAEKIAALATAPRVKITPSGRVYHPLASPKGFDRKYSIALDRSGKEGSLHMLPLLSSWTKLIAADPAVARLVAIGELVASSATVAEQLKADSTCDVDRWASL